MMAGVALAQEPRPTPTNVGPPGGGGNEESDERRGSMSGFIYEDVNGDGRCVDTEVEGENPIQGIDVQFVSSDRETVITNYSGAQGDFGLYAAGHSYWEVTVMPGAEWTVTTERTVYVPVYTESLHHENINFCLSKGQAPNAVIRLPASGGTVLLPESGASQPELQAAAQPMIIVQMMVWVTAVFGLALIVIGSYLYWQRRKA
jgi:hypothetical protein